MFGVLQRRDGAQRADNRRESSVCTELAGTVRLVCHPQGPGFTGEIPAGVEEQREQEEGDCGGIPYAGGTLTGIDVKQKPVLSWCSRLINTIRFGIIVLCS